jgi:hypothetical protein
MEKEISEVKSDLSSEDIKAFEEAEENKEVKEEAPAEKEVEPKEDKTPAEIPEKEPSPAEIKDVPGETPKERALRLEVTRLRRANREKDQGELIKEQPVVVEDDKTDEELKNLGYDDQQITGLKKVVDIIASKQGYVKKSNTYKEMADATLGGFIEEHPEYAPENDKDDVYWGRFKSILNSDYNLNGKNSKQIKSIFERVDRDVKEALGEKELDKDKIEAKKRKVGDISHGGSGSSKEEPTKTKSTLSGGNKTFVSSSHPNLVFKGFDEDELEDILKN